MVVDASYAKLEGLQQIDFWRHWWHWWHPMT
jgi:hypothetical protein